MTDVLTIQNILPTTWGFAILGHDVVIFIFSNMAAVVRAGQTSVGFWLLSCTYVFQSAAVSGGRFSNPPTSQSPNVACNFSIMKITPFLLLLLFVSGCDDHINYFIPDGFQYPDNKIEKGKTFVYQNNSTQERTFKDLRTLDMDGQHFQTLKSYDSNSVSDSVKLLNGKSFETFNFFMNKGRNPIKAENLKDTILNNGQKLGIHLTERKYQTEQIQYITTSQEQYLKDTTIIWENSKLLCLVTQANAKIEIKVKADTSINHLTKVVSNFYYAKDIGLIKYSIQFTDQNGKDNYGLWELKSIKNIVN